MLQGIREEPESSSVRPANNGQQRIEKDLLLQVLEVHLRHTSDIQMIPLRSFRRRFPVGTVLEIVTTSEVII
jgi:hypothetical protein